MVQNYKPFIQKTILNENIFVKATFTGGVKQWIKVIIRPVMVKDKLHLQFSYFDSKKDITKNYSGDEIAKKLQQVLRQQWKNISFHTTEKIFQIEIPDQGTPIIHEHTVGAYCNTPLQTHDHKKEYILSPDIPLPFLQILGIMTREGKIATDKYHKFKQINEFLQIIDQTIRRGETKFSPPITIVDFGCGSGYLTLALYYYFTEIRKISVSLIGIDSNKDLINKLSHHVQALQWQNISFQSNTISQYKPTSPADIVIALHACDTATDEALAQAITMNSSYIFASPCCHHHLQKQLHEAPTPSVFHSVFRHRILGERLGDILTDTFRALILQINGYRTEVIEFISSEHTGKNLMIKAVKTNNRNMRQYVHEYTALKRYWKVTPYLERLLKLDVG